MGKRPHLGKADIYPFIEVAPKGGSLIDPSRRSEGKAAAEMDVQVHSHGWIVCKMILKEHSHRQPLIGRPPDKSFAVALQVFAGRQQANAKPRLHSGHIFAA